MFTVLGYQSPPPTADLSFLEWWLILRQDLSKYQKKGLDTAVMLLSWMVWKERNVRVFNNVERTLNHLLTDIIAEGGNWIQAGATKLAGIGWPLRASLGGSVIPS